MNAVIISSATAISLHSYNSENYDMLPPLPPKTINDAAPQINRRKKKKIKHQMKKISNLKFSDGIRSIDFVLVFKKEEVLPKILDSEKRRIFEENLRKEGLELEYDSCEKTRLQFIKIHATKEVCRRYCEILRLRMPMKKIDKFQRVPSTTSKVVNLFSTKWNNIMKRLFYVDRNQFPEPSHNFTAIYSRDKEYLFDVDSPDFFTPTVRSRIVQFILDRSLFSLNESDPYNFGIEHLINDNIYCAAYPLHDGYCDVPGSLRYVLSCEWASLKKCFKYQPVDIIKEYFGVKIALYFSWLGFYTYMLIPASLIGLICFLYSWNTSYTDVATNEICEGNSSIKLCPQCDYNCPYLDIRDACTHTRITYLFDNTTTVLFTVFMCFWGTLFLELWKRYSAEITHRWDLTEFDKQEEYPRPEYLARLKHVTRKTVNLITNDAEPKVPFWTMRVPMTVFSFSIIIFLVAVAFAAVIGVVLYRISILAAFYACSSKLITNYALILTNITAASINLLFIVILNVLYTRLAEYLTELELHRTQTEFDDSLTLKMYLFQFVNYYASIFYIAFFKGKFVGYPKKFSRIFGYRQEECGPGGCLTELCIQLGIIMIGKQTFNTLMEIIEPFIYKWWYARKVNKKKEEHQTKTNSRLWVDDYKLLPWGPQALFPEYLEMVLQYGFVTIFVSAFPLAPLFALLNNILEMRLDAKKLLTFYRRPVSQRVKSIGIWYRILDSIGKLAIFTNSFIIAFTSEFIPKLVYMLTVNKNHTMSGYLEYSLSYMNVTELNLDELPPNPENITYCRYKDFRNPPWSSDSYDLSSKFWHVLVGRLLFMVIFQNFVTLMVIVIRWCIPDIPAELKEKIQRERYITNEIIIDQETKRAQCLSEVRHEV